MTRIAVIGTGVWGQNILKTLHTFPGVEIAWTAGRDWRTKLDRAVKSSIPTDGVAIAVPAPAQALIARTCLDASMAVFLEKPMALTLADARLIRDRAFVMGDLPVLVDHVGLFAAGYETFRTELIGRGITRLETLSGNRGPFRNWGPHSALWDWGSHEAAFALDLIGTPDVITAKEKDGVYSVNLCFRDASAKLVFGNGFTERRRALLAVADGLQIILDSNAPGMPPLTKALSVWLDAVEGEPRDERVGCGLGIKVVELLADVQAML